jgi:hypothetical protein
VTGWPVLLVWAVIVALNCGRSLSVTVIVGQHWSSFDALTP